MPTLDHLLETARSKGEFEAIVLTDWQGGIIAAARDDGTSPETLSALLDVATRLISRTEDRAQLAKDGESIFFDMEGRQVICRWFDKPQPRLVIILAPHGKPYKRAVGALVKEIKTSYKK